MIDCECREDAPDDGGGAKQHRKKQKSASEEHRGKEPVLAAAQPIAQHTDEPQKGKSRERHEIQR